MTLAGHGAVRLRHRDHLDPRRLRHVADRQCRRALPLRRVSCETNHIGASGLIFGWLTFLIVFGFFTRKVWEIVVGVVVLFVYGSVLLGVLPGTLGGCHGRDICAGRSPACSPPICSPGPNARRARLEDAKRRTHI